MTAAPLPNPERGWISTTSPPTRAEIEARLGPIDGGFEPLGGGLANATARVGDRVIRIYRRDPEQLEKEAALLGRGWGALRVPRVLGVGDDYLVLENVPHGPLLGDAPTGARVGAALAEIHAQRFERAGSLDGALACVPFEGGIEAAFVEYVEAALLDDEGALARAIAARLRGALDAPPALLHGDFKVSNVHDARGEVLVLDWELAYAGPALLDVGQLFRWGAPDAFRDAFAASYVAHGGELDRDWTRGAADLDLVNLAGLLARSTPGSRRAADVRAQILATLAM